jgi:trafficking protein particle complex subunit 8
LYTTGDVAGAVRFFLGLLRGSTVPSSPTPLFSNGHANEEDNMPGTDKVFLDDFRVAFAVRTHYSSSIFM